MFTGEFYCFYSEKAINDVFSLFKERMSCIDYTSWQRRDDDGEEVIFFYKNEEMLEYHEENGYNLDINGQGCFCIEARNVNLYGTASISYEFNEKKKSNSDPHYANLIFENVCYYFMIIPEIIDESEFCKEIYDCFVKTIKDA